MRTGNVEHSKGPIKLNPDFSDLHDPRVIRDHVNGLFSNGADKGRFPVEVFPEPIRKIIRTTNECLNFPNDYIGAAILYALSVATGNSHEIKVRNGWHERAVLYLAIVGRSGIAKSPALAWALKPLEDRNQEAYHRFKIAESAYNATPKKEKEQQGIEPPEKPFWKQTLVQDFTPEALASIHEKNPRGIGVYADELKAWIANFNRYNKGSEEQFWLSAWSLKPIIINRKTAGDNYIPVPFIPIVGTIQPGVLKEIAKGRTENGFLYRILFAYPDNLKREDLSDEELPRHISDSWASVLFRLLDIPVPLDAMQTPTPHELRFSLEANKAFKKWHGELTEAINSSDSDSIREMLSKMDAQVIRIALCLEMARYACNESDLQNVGIEAIEGAIRLGDYFKECALKVLSSIEKISPVDNLPDNKKALYDALPEQFTTGEGAAIAEEQQIPKRTFMDFLGNRELFAKLEHGVYKKLH